MNEATILATTYLEKFALHDLAYLLLIIIRRSNRKRNIEPLRLDTSEFIHANIRVSFE